MNFIFLIILIVFIITCVGYLMAMLISTNVTYAVWYDSPCKILFEQLDFSKKMNEKLFLKVQQGRIWGFEQIINEKGCK